MVVALIVSSALWHLHASCGLYHGNDMRHTNCTIAMAHVADREALSRACYGMGRQSAMHTMALTNVTSCNFWHLQVADLVHCWQCHTCPCIGRCIDAYNVVLACTLCGYPCYGTRTLCSANMDIIVH